MKYISGWLAQEAKLESIYPISLYPILIKDHSMDGIPCISGVYTQKYQAWVNKHPMRQHQRSPRTGSQSRQEDPIQNTLELHRVILVGC